MRTAGDDRQDAPIGVHHQAIPAFYVHAMESVRYTETSLSLLASRFGKPLEMEKIIAQQFDRVGEFKFLCAICVASFHGIDRKIGNQFGERR